MMPAAPTTQRTAADPPNLESIRAFLTAKIADALHAQPESIDPNAPLADYALDSIVVFDIVGDIACWLQRDLDASLLWNHPSIEAAAQFLVSESHKGEDKAEERQFIDLPGDAALKRPIVSVDPTQEVLIARGNSGTTVLCFAGQLHQMCMPISLFDRYLAEHDFTAVYVRDFTRSLHLLGVSSLGGFYKKTVAALARLAEELGTRRLITLGNSGGGLASVTYGLDLGASKMLMFSGPTCLSRLDTRDREPRTGHSLEPVFELLSRLKDQTRLDLKVRLELEQQRASMVHLFYGERMMEDRLQAERLRGMASVFHHAIKDYAGHDTIRHLARHGALRPELIKLLG